MSRLKQEQNLKQTLTPQQVLQANLYQLNSADLEQRILKELEENPALDLIDNDTIIDENNDEESEEKEFEWDDESFENFDDTISDQSNNQKLNFNDIPIKDEPNFLDHLNNQIKDLNLSPIEFEIAEQIIGNIDEDGYLTAETILISDRLNVKESAVLNILFTIQKLDPLGIGSRSLKECLLSQIEEKKVDPIVWDILKNYFNDFANHRYEKIIASLKCSEEELRNAMDTISTLNPKPGLGIEKNLIIIPDIIMENYDENFHITINDSSLPELIISNDYKKMLIKNKDKKVVKFVQNKLESAQWFIDALKQRHQTLLLIMNAIVKRQSDFFNETKKILKPMILKNIAEDINMDISTISRMTNGKYVQLSYGIFELKYFFSEGIKKKTGELVSNKMVKKLLKEIINEENKQNPLGDEKLTIILNKKGFKIARRTVTKYRESLKIPVGRLRKEL